VCVLVCLCVCMLLFYVMYKDCWCLCVCVRVCVRVHDIMETERIWKAGCLHTTEQHTYTVIPGGAKEGGRHRPCMCLASLLQECTCIRV